LKKRGNYEELSNYLFSTPSHFCRFFDQKKGFRKFKGHIFSTAVKFSIEWYKFQGKKFFTAFLLCVHLTQNLFNSGYLDNEPPKGLGQHIFAAILINHPYFQPYYHTGTTYRGMNITPDELAQYKVDSIVLTRSFLSTSKNEIVAEMFKDATGPLTVNADGKQPVRCVYKVINPRSSLDIETMSFIPDEREVLILPFVVFRITAVDMNSPITIYLEEFDSNKL
jgi:hypothetical protein